MLQNKKNTQEGEQSWGNWDLWDLFVHLWMAVRAAACADDRTKLPPALPPNSLFREIQVIEAEKYLLQIKKNTYFPTILSIMPQHAQIIVQNYLNLCDICLKK